MCYSIIYGCSKHVYCNLTTYAVLTYHTEWSWRLWLPILTGLALFAGLPHEKWTPIICFPGPNNRNIWTPRLFISILLKYLDPWNKNLWYIWTPLKYFIPPEIAFNTHYNAMLNVAIMQCNCKVECNCIQYFIPPSLQGDNLFHLKYLILTKST